MKRKQQKQRPLPKNSFVNYLINFDEIVDKRYIKTSSGFYSIIKIDGIDIFHYVERDQDSCYYNFAQAEMNLNIPHKYVFVDSTPNYEKQKQFIAYKLLKQVHPYLEELLERQLFLFSQHEEHSKDRSAYVILFSETTAQLDKSMDMFIHEMKDTVCNVCEDMQIIKVLSSMLTFDSFNEYDNVLESVCPSGLQFSSTHMKIGNKFVTSLVAYEYSESVLNLHFANMFNFRGVLTTVDISCIQKDKAKKDISRSLDEIKSRRVLNSNVGDATSDEMDFNNLQKLFVDLDRGNEQILAMTLRLYLSADSLEELAEMKEHIIQQFSNNSIALYLPQNSMQQEFMALTRESNIIGNAIPLTDTFSKQYPFNYQNYVDDSGLFFGTTVTGGNVIINTFNRSSIITSFDMLIIGIKGSGKTITIKTMLQDILCLGNKAMVIDIENEYSLMAEKLGGKVIKLGRYPVINPLEIRKAFADNDSESSSNFAAEISRIITFMYQYVPELTNQEVEEFKTLLLMTYKKFEITADTDISKLTPTQFPIFKDLLTTLRSKLYKVYKNDDENEFSANLSENRIKTLENLEVFIKNLAEGVYSSIFNGYSSIDISKENFIVFNVKELSEMDDKVFNAQLFNILSYMWQEICKNVSYNQSLKNPWDRRHVVAVIDEAHRFISTKNPQALEFIEKLTRRTRKYDAALWFASQSILDFDPSGTSEHSDKIKTIFNNVTYRIIMKQSSECIELLQDTFKQFTYSELEAATNFEAGDMLISFGGSRHKLNCHRDIFKEDLLYIGNSRDKEEIERELEQLEVTT